MARHVHTYGEFMALDVQTQNKQTKHTQTNKNNNTVDRKTIV